MTRLLVVEDSETILLLLKTRLEMAGYQVATATDGQQALDAMAEVKPELVVLDVMMPVKSGLEVLAEMRAGGDSTPVILCTAHREDTDISQALAGADGWVTKPIDFAELFEKIETLVGAS